MKALIFIVVILALSLAPYFGRSQVSDNSADLTTKVNTRSADMPPSVAIATAGMGPFRGYLLAVLWTRVVDLELNEEYSESFEIARWISRLQPRYAAIWKYQATQLAVNLPALFPNKDDKWTKIKQGIDLLRSEGILKNPDSHQLYDYLGWIYYNRIGQAIDENHEYYGAKIAHEMQSVLGRRLIDSRYGKDALLKQFDLVINAKLFPESDDAEYKVLVNKLNEHEMRLDGDFLRMWNRFEIYIRSAGFFTSNQKGESTKIPEVNNELCLWLRDNPEITNYISKHILPYLLKKELERYNMQPALMRQMILDYGPLDWRHPNVLALYWTRQAIAVLNRANEGQKVHSITTARMEYIYLLGMVRNGRVHYDPWNNSCQWLPEPAFLVPCANALESIRQRVVSGELRTDQNRVFEEENLFKAYLGFMDTAIMTTSMYSDDEEAAQRYFDILKERVIKKNGGLPPEMSGTVDDYILTRVSKFVGVRKENMNQFIGAMVRRALWEALANGRVRAFNKYIDRAIYVFEAEKAANPYKYRNADFKKLILKSCIDEFKNETVTFEQKVNAWHLLNPDMKIAITPNLTGYFNDLCHRIGVDVTLNFQVKELSSNTKKSAS